VCKLRLTTGSDGPGRQRAYKVGTACSGHALACWAQQEEAVACRTELLLHQGPFCEPMKVNQYCMVVQD
jgi:hypothetical protein